MNELLDVAIDPADFFLSLMDGILLGRLSQVSDTSHHINLSKLLTYSPISFQFERRWYAKPNATSSQ